MAQAAQRLKLAIAAMLLALGIAAGLWAWQHVSQPLDRKPLGVMSSLPIYWPEGADLTMVIEGGGQVPWVRSTLEERYELSPLDTLAAAPDGEGGQIDPLAGLDRLLIAQPRGLSPADNAALDQWVRGGGRLLFLLDPMLTGRYAVPLGDPSHPVAMGLIPPVMVRWGLGMQFNEAQPLEVRSESYGSGSIPVLLAGEMLLADPDPEASDEELAARGDCRILGSGIAAQCDVGKGRVTLVADAALLEFSDPPGEAPDQLLALTEFAFN